MRCVSDERLRRDLSEFLVLLVSGATYFGGEHPSPSKRPCGFLGDCPLAPARLRFVSFSSIPTIMNPLKTIQSHFRLSCPSRSHPVGPYLPRPFWENLSPLFS